MAQQEMHAMCRLEARFREVELWERDVQRLVSEVERRQRELDDGERRLEARPPAAPGEDLLHQLQPLLGRRLGAPSPAPASGRPFQQQRQVLAPTQTRPAHLASVNST